jgi:hypothetical protein
MGPTASGPDRIAPAPAAPKPAPTALIISLGLTVVLVIVAVLIIRPWSGGTGEATSGTDGSASRGTVPGVTADATGPAQATASAACVSPPSQDAGNNPTDYEPSNAIDGRTDTAWRCDGDGTGQNLEIDLSHPVIVTRIGLIPGLAKTDPYDNSDRYQQGRRISAVRYTMDETSYTQQFDTDPSDRALQSITIPPTQTSRITITILSSVPGSPVGNLPPTEKVAISEVQLGQ